MKPEIEAPIKPATDQISAPSRRAYAPPQLDILGDIRDLTLGGSPGTGDSGQPLNFKPPV